MKVAEKLDWLEYAVLYTKNPGVIRKERDDLSDIDIHNHKFGDRLIAALLQDPNFDKEESDNLVKQFCEFVVPEEWHSYFNFNYYKILPYSVRGYAFSIEVGKENKAKFIIRVPLKEIGDFDRANNFYMVENVRTGCFMTYNSFIGYKIVFSGSNIPTIRKKIGNDRYEGTLYPVRFDVENWIIKLQKYNTAAKLSRVDFALDIGYDFNELALKWQENPRQFKVPYYKQNCRMDYNPYTGAGAICCGKRGSANNSYLRIYNKAAEAAENAPDIYPWDDYFNDGKIPNCYNGKKGNLIEVPWTRFEFELRGATAIHFLGDYYDKILDDDTPGHFIFDYIGLYDIETEQDFKYVEVGQYCYMSFSSLWEDVIKSYNLYAKNETENFIQFREELHAASYSISAASMRFLYRLTPYRTGMRMLKSVNRTANAFDIYKNGDADSLDRVAKMIASADDLVELIRLIDNDFADAATKKRLDDLSRMCCISKARASEILNEAGMKGYFKNIVDQCADFKYNSVNDVNDDELDEVIENPFEINYLS